MKVLRLKSVSFMLVFVLMVGQLFAQQKTNPDSIRQKMQWFADAKLGIFIHWGIYAVADVSESWSFHNKQISWKDYMNQSKSFTAAKYDPADWASLIAASGARYSVITTKHHDGVALWDTKENHYSTVKNTPAKRDLLTPFYQELRKRNVKAGAYFSLIDWSHPDYPGFLKDSSRYKVNDDPARWQRFKNFYQNQLNEVTTKFKPDLYWFDGDWEHSAEEWESQKVREGILKSNPNAIINGRLMGYGDYETP
jgi:alpha-L-fucosidase